jgi:hypothetical protein
MLLLAVAGCSSDTGRGQQPGGGSGPGDKVDTGTSAETGTTPDTVADTTGGGDRDTGTADDTGGNDADAGDEGLPPTEARQFCASGGTAQGGGMTLVHCTSPLEVSGPSLEGDDLTLQPGAFRVISE